MFIHIIIIFYLNLSALQMKESLESGGAVRDHENFNCQLEISYELGIFRHRECPYRLD